MQTLVEIDASKQILVADCPAPEPQEDWDAYSSNSGRSAHLALPPQMCVALTELWRASELSADLWFLAAFLAVHWRYRLDEEVAVDIHHWRQTGTIIQRMSGETSLINLAEQLRDAVPELRHNGSGSPDSRGLLEPVQILTRFEVHFLDGTGNNQAPGRPAMFCDSSSRFQFFWPGNLFGLAQPPQIASHFYRLLVSSLRGSRRPIRDLEMMTEDEYRCITSVWCGAPGAYPQEAVHRLFEQQAEQRPEAVALVCGESEVTFADLNQAANRLASYLRKLGIGAGAFVGVHAKKSVQSICSILAVLKAGGAYVPLDPGYPPERLRFLVGDSRLRCIICERASKEFAELEVSLICLEEIQTVLADLDAENFPGQASLESPAYVSYTSGTTGVPKGVLYTHRHLVHRADSIRGNDVCGVQNSLSFGFSLSRVFPPLIRGARLVLLPDGKATDPDGIVRALESRKVSVLAVVPSALRQILESARRGKHSLLALRSVTIAGAALTPDLVGLFFETLPHTHLFYGFGASETGPVTLREVTKDERPDSRNVGRPLPNNQVLILGRDMTLLPPGTVGELCVASRHLAQRYLNQPELTSEKFVTNPFETEWSGDTLYRTGDLACYLPDGQIQLAGREDQQVKVRGFRIELAEVEYVLAGHEGVEEAVVICDAIDGENRLIAYVAPRASCELGLRQLRSYLLARLPEYMCPAVFVVAPKLPLNSNGKVDRQALPRPLGTRPSLDSFYEAPRNEMEEQIAAIWGRLLELREVGIHDDFLELGGDSLFVTRLAEALQDEFGVSLSWESLFQEPTIAEIAGSIRRQTADWTL